MESAAWSGAGAAGTNGRLATGVRVYTPFRLRASPGAGGGGKRAAAMTSLQRRQQKRAFREASKGKPCHLCGELLQDLGDGPEDITVDHLVPESLGGEDTPANWYPAHRLCNVQRGIAPAQVLALWRRLRMAGKGIPCPAKGCPVLKNPGALAQHFHVRHGLPLEDSARWLEWAVRRAAREAGMQEGPQGPQGP